IGSMRVIPNYYIMGLAKASLESNVRYMASILGKKNIRVNAISSGPIKTASSYAIKNFKILQNNSKLSSLIQRYVTSEEIGNVASFLASDLSKGITGSIIYVDNGFHINGMNNFM
ncbi:MAG: SDR family oxidoreductase, partial [Buchnera aphidicola]|nr:SDR family oxidoreductase [Buchnera aphidicola]